MNPIATKLLEAAGYAAAGVATKAVGSFYRVEDDENAPKDVFVKTVKREGILLGLTGAFMMGIQLLFTGLIHRRLPHISPFVESVTRLALAVPAFAIAEEVSREIGGSRSEIWDKSKNLFLSPLSGSQNTRKDDDDDDDFDDRRAVLNRPHPQFQEPAFARMPIVRERELSFRPPLGYYQRNNSAGLYFNA